MNSKFDSFGRQHIDWRWEFLVKAITAVPNAWNDLAAYFRLEAMLQGDSGKLASQNLVKVNDVIKGSWWFPIVCHLYKAVASVLEHYASKLEGCWCHEDQWCTKRKWADRVKAVEKNNRSARVRMEGAHGPVVGRRRHPGDA